jgi:hypothetical protein
LQVAAAPRSDVRIFLGREGQLRRQALQIMAMEKMLREIEVPRLGVVAGGRLRNGADQAPRQHAAEAGRQLR